MPELPSVAHRRSRRSLPVLLAVVGFLLGGCGGGSDEDSAAQAGGGGPTSPTSRPSRQAALVDIAAVDDLRERFNADEGQPRLLLLLSPT